MNHFCSRISPRLRISSVLLLIAVLLLHQKAMSNDEDVIIISSKQAAQYLHRNITDSGRFIYKRHYKGIHNPSTRYNLLRHAGTIYSLASYHKIFPATDSELNNLIRANDYLLNCCNRPLTGESNITTIWSDPQITGTKHPSKAKLGAAGLALTAFISTHHITQHKIDPANLIGLGKFVEFMQQSDGRFVSRFIPDAGGKDDRWTSLYYPGEAALGLYFLYTHTLDEQWIELAIDALRYLGRNRENLTVIPADHWALIATAKIMSLHKDVLDHTTPQSTSWDAKSKVPSIKDNLMEHAEKVVASILDEQILDPKNKCLHGGFDKTGRVTPTATRLEGLLASLEFLTNVSLRKRIVDAVEHGISFLLKAQIKIDSYNGAFPRINPHCESTDPRASEIRIDYVQHALSAMLMHLKLNKN